MKVLRATLVAALLVGAAACGITNPRGANARLSFQLDTTCRKLFPQAQVYTLAVDGAAIGTAKLVPGEASAEFGVAPGTHLVGASTIDGSSWAPLSVTMERNQQVVYLMQCLWPFGARAGTLAATVRSP